MARMYSVLNQSSFPRSKIAFDFWMPLKLKRSISSRSCKISCLRIGRRPSQQRKEIAESLGNNPFFLVGDHASRAMTLAKSRFVGPEDERHVREHRQRLAQRLRTAVICLGVLERWSAPRTTCVMRMSMSSTTTLR